MCVPMSPRDPPVSPQAYERGIALFRWPNVAAVWHSYLTKFVARYGGRKLERARDLFEQALDGCPQKYAKSKAGGQGGGHRGDVGLGVGYRVGQGVGVGLGMGQGMG